MNEGVGAGHAAGMPPGEATSADKVLVIRLNEAPAANADPRQSVGQLLEWTKALIVPIVTVLITIIGGYLFTSLQKSREDRAATVARDKDVRDSNERLYAQLTTQREQSDSQLRMGMFGVIIGHFLTESGHDSLQDKVLQLELLASNFNQSLDLAPLFKELARRLPPEQHGSATEKQELRRRLDLAASSVIFKQVTSLGRHGFTKETQIPLSNWEQSVGTPFIDERIPLSQLVPPTAGKPLSATATLQVAIEIIDVDFERREVEIRSRVNYEGTDRPRFDRHFWVGQYDFPMLDNTQLADGLRMSVVMSDFFEPSSGENRERDALVTLHLIVFPAADASLKDKQDYDDVLLGMLAAQGRQNGIDGGKR